MASLHLRPSFHLLIFAALVASTHFAAAAAPFSDIISFGDSLTDVGNVAGITVDNGSYSPLIPGYYEETHFSDNVLWIETLANYWGLPARTPGRDSDTTLPPETSGNVWAWGGSEAGSGTVQPTGVTEPIPNLLTEVSGFLTYNTPNSTTLYSIWSGADNLLVGGHAGPVAAAEAADAVKTAMQNLEAAGARNFLIFNMPKMGDTPDAQDSGDDAVIAAADEYSDSYNATLAADIDELRLDPLFHGTIYTVDAYAELALIVDTVKGGGTYTPDFFVPGDSVSISNVTDTGLDYYNTNGGIDPTNYLFWDAVHPTTQGHQVIAGLALQAIPEPGTLSLLLIGAAACVVVRQRCSQRR